MRVLLSLLLILSFSAIGIAGEIWVAWELSDAPGIIGYRLYVSLAPMPDGQPLPFYNYYRVVEAGDSNICGITDLPFGTYYLRVTAYANPDFIIPTPWPNAGKPYEHPESDFSNELCEVLSYIDWTPPVFESTEARIMAGTSVMFIWNTNEPADTQIEYGEDTTYPEVTAWKESFVIWHTETVSGLTPGKTYHFRLRSMDANYNQCVSADYPIKMPDSNPVNPVPPAQPIINFQIERPKQ